MKLSTAIRRFEEQLRAEGKSSITREVYIRDLELLRRWLGQGTAIDGITPHKLTRFINSPVFSHTKGTPKAAVSMNRSKSAIRTFFQFTVDAGYVKQNPARLIRLARTQPKPPRPMSNVDVKKLFAVLRKDRSPIARRDEVMFTLMLGTGIRLGSLVGLSVSDVDLASGTLRIQAKGGIEQVVYLPPAIRKQLQRYVKGLDDSTALFQTQASRRLQSRQIQLRFSKWLRQAGLTGHTVHSLRHTFGTRLYQQTRDLRLVQHALGHRHVSTTEVYTGINDGRLRRELRHVST